MDKRDKEEKEDATIMIVERRKHRDRELTSAEVMRIVRNRSARRIKNAEEHSVDQDEKR